MSDAKQGFLRRVAAGGFAVFAFATARADCIPLPARDLREIDAKFGRRPAELARTAAERLGGKLETDPMRRAQLEAILAKAGSALGKPDEARTAIKAARDALRELNGAAGAATLRRMLDIIEISLADGAGPLRSGVSALTAELAVTAPASLERSCLLSTRASAEAELVELDKAASDGVTAYEIAKDGGWDEARAQAAYALATVYRRSGLYEDAEAMIDEAIAWARTQNDPAWLSFANYVRGTILIDSKKYAEARVAAESSGDLARSIGDASGIATANALLCDIEVLSDHIDAAAAVCFAGDRELAQAGKMSFVLSLEDLRARIELKKRRPREALSRIDRLLAHGIRDQLGMRLPSVYADRAAALAALGRERDAYKDLQQAQQLGAELDLQRQALAVAVLNAKNRAEMLLTSNHALQERMARQQAELAQRKLSAHIWMITSIAASLGVALLGYLLIEMRRRERALRREETILRMTSQYAPDALCLLDAKGRVRFANRPLFGEAPAPRDGRPLREELPERIRDTVSEELRRLYTDHEPVSFGLDLDRDDGERRNFELRAAPIIEHGNLIGVTLRAIDVTDMRRLERDIVNLASHERRRLGADLHEGLAQELAGVSLLLQSLKHTIDRRLPDLVDVTSEIVNYVHGTVAATRDIAERFTPVQAARGSLSAALQRFAADSSRRHGIPIDVLFTGDDAQLPEVTADQIYSIVREFVGEPVRHRRHQRIAIEVVRRAASITAVLSADGHDVGADTAPAERESDLGRMAYRAKLIGGTLTSSRQPQGGIRVEMTVPLDHRAVPA